MVHLIRWLYLFYGSRRLHHIQRPGALFEHWGLLAEPLMYLSGYLKQHQAEYYRRLSAIRTEGDWETRTGSKRQRSLAGGASHGRAT